jgi:integrase
MGIPVTSLLRFDVDEKERYLNFLRELGSNIRFETDAWVCDSRTRYPYGDKHIVTLYFAHVPAEYREFIKYYAILRLLNGITVRTVKTDLCGLAVFCTFLSGCGVSELSAVNVHSVYLFRQKLDDHGYASCTKSRIWSNVSALYEIMKDFDGGTLKNPFRKNPYPTHEKKEEKFISDFVMEQLDRAFYDADIFLEIRTVYWISRLIPSRISEVLSMKFDCMKRYMGDYVLFIPTWKQNGGHKAPILRSIHIQNEGMGAFLIGLIEKQQKVAENLQEFMPEGKRGALFTYQGRLNKKDGTTDWKQNHFVLQWYSVSYRLKEACERYDIRDENGSRYVFTSHQLRHNGITDRLAAGFTIEQVTEMTGHHGDAMLWGAYAHLDQNPELTLNRQRKILNEPAGSPYVLFGGRILHMDEQLEARLLKNLRAHRVRGGICCDVTNCKSDMWSCLDCENFIPDKDHLPFFVEQAVAWEEKAKRFAQFPLIRQNACRNADLFQRIVSKIRMEVTEGE